jgi:hypothetical protein
MGSLVLEVSRTHVGITICTYNQVLWYRRRDFRPSRISAAKL